MEKMEERRKFKGDKEEYNRLDKNIDRACKEAKEAWLNNECDSVEGLIKSNQHDKMYRKIQELTGKKKSGGKSQCIKSKDGDILFEEMDIKNKWAEYITTLFDDNRGVKPETTGTGGPSILKSEIVAALRAMKDNKAAGLDNITTEGMKALDESGTDLLWQLCNKIYMSGELPSEMKKSEFVTLPKKAKALECSEFRTISLMSHVTKLLLRVILARLKRKTGAVIEEEQFGFKKNSGTKEAIFTLRNIIEGHFAKGREVYGCFIDYAKAFDRVKHEKLIEILENLGVDGKDIRLIVNLYWDQTASVRVANDRSPEAPIKRGVRQGCVLSPELFNVYTQAIFNHLDDYVGNFCWWEEDH